MLKNSKKTILFTLMAAVLFMMPAAPTTAVSAAQNDISQERSSETTDRLSCIFDAVLTMIQDFGPCEESNDQDLCYADAVITMVLSVFACTTFDTQQTCVFNIVLDAIDDIVLCQDIGCVLSTLFSMIIDILNCIDTAAPATV